MDKLILVYSSYQHNSKVSSPFFCWGRQFSKKFCLRGWVIYLFLGDNCKFLRESFACETWVKISNSVFDLVMHINLNIFPDHGEIQSFQKHLYPWGKSRSNRVVTHTVCLPFCWSWPGSWDIPWQKEGTGISGCWF